MNTTVRELVRKSGIVRMSGKRYASCRDQDVDQLVNLIVQECVQTIGSIAECRKYQELVRQHLARRFDSGDEF